MFAVGFLLLSSGSALSASRQDTILYADEVRSLPTGTVVSALGDAGVGLPLRTHTAVYNPAALSYLSDYEVWFEGALLYGGLSKQATLAAGVPVQQDIDIGLTVTPFFSSTILQYDTLPGTYQERIEDPSLRSDGNADGFFFNDHYSGLLTVAKKFTLNLPRSSGVSSVPLPFDIGVGCSFSFMAQTMDPEGKLRMGMNVNVDAGLLLRMGIDYDLARKQVSREVCVGISMRNILPTKIVWLQSPYHYSEPVYNIQYYGLSYFDRTGFLRAHWTVAAAICRQLSEGINSRDAASQSSALMLQTYHAGIEAEFWNLLAFRAGISNRVPTLGAGIQYKRFFLDYAFRFDEINFSPLRLSVGCNF